MAQQCSALWLGCGATGERGVDAQAYALCRGPVKTRQQEGGEQGEGSHPTKPSKRKQGRSSGMERFANSQNRSADQQDIGGLDPA
jgi:hypothetical protein